MVLTSAKKPINIVTSYHVISLFFHLILIFSLHCQLFLLISGYYTTCNIKITYQCKIIIVPEEGWFGQPKYSTHKKDPSTLCRLLLLFSSKLMNTYMHGPSFFFVSLLIIFNFFPQIFTILRLSMACKMWKITALS